MTDTAVQNALTPGEWHTATLWHAGKMVGGTVRGAVVLSLPDEHRHAAAALALYGQPYGFTRADVELLRQLKFYGAPFTLADRIAALLPPETP